MKEFRASMDTIRKTSADMIGQIEEKLKELHIERPEQEVTAVEQTEELSVMQYAEQTINVWNRNGRFSAMTRETLS